MAGGELAAAIDQFNQGDFYGCHDALEALWVEAPVDEKKFYQGLLQISVACYHLGNSNWRGATVLLGEGRFRLQAYEPRFCPDDQILPQAVDVIAVRAAAQELLLALQAIQPEDVGQLLQEFTSGDRSYPKIPME
jgi:uncharacterized protein